MKLFDKPQLRKVGYQTETQNRENDKGTISKREGQKNTINYKNRNIVEAADDDVNSSSDSDKSSNNDDDMYNSLDMSP